MISKYITALRADLKRPGGGWTTGALTLLLAGLFPVVGSYTHPLIGFVWFVGFLTVHMVWGAYGYYPRTMVGR
jgi:hypothetical protein